MAQPEGQDGRGRQQLNIIVTGFGSFQGVAANPTEVLVHWLKEQYLAQSSPGTAAADPAHTRQPVRSLPGAARIHSAQVLKVSAQAASTFVDEQLLLFQASANALSNGPVLLLHFGVDIKRGWFNLECQAVNNATFRCPDEDGWEPNQHPIEHYSSADRSSNGSSDGTALNVARRCSLDLSALRQQLAGKGHDVRLSEDAGRFVCNFIYYKSLTASQKVHGRRCYSLFVHCPSFEAVAPAAQKAFVADLLQALASALATPASSSPEAVSNHDDAAWADESAERVPQSVS